MKAYIKINNNDEIIDLFFEHQKIKFDGTEIFYSSDLVKLKINGKSISSEYGVPIFIWDEENAMEKTQTEIDNDPDFVQRYKVMKKAELNKYIGDNLLNVIIPGTRSLNDIVAQWNTFKTNSSSWTTKQDVDNAFETAINWLTNGGSK